jgi:hypothetical protein
VTPEVGSVDEQLEMTFCGAQFEAGAMPSLRRAGFPELFPRDMTFIAPFELRALFDLTGVPTGYWNPTVFNPNLQSSVSLNKGLLVWDQIGMWDVYPDRVGNLATSRLTILGNGFYGLDNIRLQLDGQSVVGTNLEVITDEKLRVDFDLAGQPQGEWALVADFADGSQDLLSEAVRVETPLLRIVDYSPRKGGNTGQVRVLIQGDYLRDGVVAKLRRGADEITGGEHGLTRDGLVATFNLDKAAPGAWDLVLTNGHVPGDEAVRAGGFTVEAGVASQPWIRIVGEAMVRTGQPAFYRIVMGNRSNVDALVVPVIHGLPEDVAWSLKLPQGNPPVVQYNSVRSKVKDGKRAILLPVTRLPANQQSVEYQLTLQVPDDDGNPMTNRFIQFGAVLEK